MHILKVQIEYEDQYKVVSQQRTKALIQKENYYRIQWITSVHMFINAKLCFTLFPTENLFTRMIDKTKYI